MRERTIPHGPLAFLAVSTVLLAAPVHADGPAAPASPSTEDPGDPGAAPRPVQRVGFREAVQRALDHNPAMTTAETEVQRIRALVEQARAGSLPVLSANGTYTRIDAERVLSGRTIQGADSVNLNAAVTVPVVAAQAWGRWSRSTDGVRVAQRSAEETRRQVAATAARAYLSVSSQHRIVATLERARANASAHLEFARARSGAGLGRATDEVRAAQDLAAVDVQLANARAVLEQLQETLGVITGADGPLDGVDDADTTAVPALASTLDSVPVTRPDLRAADARVRAAEHAVRDGWLDFVPTLQAAFVAYYQNPPSLTQPLTGWQFQLALSVPLFDGGLRYGQAHERQALLRQARTSLEASVRQAQGEVRAAARTILRADEALAAAVRAAGFAHRAVDLADQAYRAGAANNLEWIDAQRRARDADAAMRAAEDNAAQARLNFLVSAGLFP